jgi:hypothetical protein
LVMRLPGRDRVGLSRGRVDQQRQKLKPGFRCLES